MMADQFAATQPADRRSASHAGDDDKTIISGDHAFMRAAIAASTAVPTFTIRG
jgi:hypothetical protein